VVCLSVCLFVGHVHESCKTAVLIEMPFGLVTQIGPRNHVFDGVEIPTGRGNFGGCPKSTASHFRVIGCKQSIPAS